jgi:hypothetical protein
MLSALPQILLIHEWFHSGGVTLTFLFSFLCHVFYPLCTKYCSVSSVAPPRFVFHIYSFKSWSTTPLAFVFQHIFLPRKDVITLKKWFMCSWVYSQQMEEVSVRKESPNHFRSKRIRVLNCCSVTTEKAVKREQSSNRQSWQCEGKDNKSKWPGKRYLFFCRSNFTDGASGLNRFPFS